MGDVVTLNSRKPPVEPKDMDYQVGAVAAMAAVTLNEIGQYLSCTGNTPQDFKVRNCHAEALYNMAEIAAGIGKMLRKEPP